MKHLLLFLFFCLGIFPAAKSNTSLPIVPKPAHESISGRQVTLEKKWNLYSATQHPIGSEFIESIFDELGVEINSVSSKNKALITVSLNSKKFKNPEAYQLEVNDKGKIIISAATQRGVLYAFQSLRQIAKEENNSIILPICKITDEPSLSQRTFILDERNHYYGMETIKQLLDEQARLKMNTLLWHQAEDFNNDSEVRQIKEYASDRGIEVLVERNTNQTSTSLTRTSYSTLPLAKSYSFNPSDENLDSGKEVTTSESCIQPFGTQTPNITNLYYLIFPRLAAFAESGWTKAADKDYHDFCHRVKDTERRWRKMGYFNQQPSFARQDDTFTLWQLPSVINTIGNSYVIQTDDGKVIVVDGGVKEEEAYLRGFLAALGNVVDCWFVSHPHPDHIGAITNILQNQKGLTIRQICHSTFSDKLLDKEPEYKAPAKEYYEAANKSGTNISEAQPGMVFTFGNTTFKILAIKNEELTQKSPYNNSSMVIKVSDPLKSVLLLGDIEIAAGDKLLNGPYRDELDCDYLQLSHHGQQGVSMDFYRTVKFRACLWPTPTWVYNNDGGRGFNTANLKTMETRETINELNITEQYFSFSGLSKIE